MTVGELANERIRAQARQGRGGIASEADAYCRMANAPIVALQSLGIWDAEVLEGEATTRWVGWPIGDRKKMGHEQVVSFGNKRPFKRFGIEAGDRVRVIVLKEEKGA